MARKIASIVSLVLLLQLSVNGWAAKAAVFDNQPQTQKTQVAPTVTHIQENYVSGSTREAVNILDVNLTDPYTELSIGLPTPINSLQTTTNLAREHNRSGHRVVGATNASFFLGNGYPANLLAENNRIINYGILGENFESPTQNPVAFGISKSGKAMADYYSTDLSFTVNGTKYPLDRINSERTDDTNVLYTPAQKTTGTNEWGVEIIVEKASQDMKEIHFGDQVTGTVAKVTRYGEDKNAAIPADGFVISVQNKDLATKLSSLPAGTPIEVALNIDQKWQDAEFILAAGPLLVKDGKVNISMPTSSSFSKSRQPRTAIGVDSTGTRVFLVTVDGRQKGYSNGASLPDLASLLIKKGASAAINLDGGGSTAMVVRKPADWSPTLVNRPSDGSERRVSAILQVVNTAPTGQAQSFKIGGVPSEVFKGTSVNLTVTSGYDEYMNPLSINPESVDWSVTGNIGQVEGAKFTATANGTGKIIGEYQGARAEIAVTVKNIGDKPEPLSSFDTSNEWTASAARAKASIATSNAYEPYRQGGASLKLTYDFTAGEAGTKAAYAIAKSPIPILGYPENIGVWAYGDGSAHWLRAMIIDGNGEKHTINFTEDGEFNWNGWKYVSADLPEDLVLPLKFERIYLTEPNAERQNKGVVYFDQLQAVYKENHQELLFTDVNKGYWAFDSIDHLSQAGLINGYPNGTFRPDNTITRAEAATIIARELNLKASSAAKFDDVKSTHYAYKSIAAVSEAGILTGRVKGSFSPDGKLTRAEMATILKRAYNLVGTSNQSFSDVKRDFWAYDEIDTLVANELTTGYPDQTFKPNNQITRAEFSTFLDRVLE